MQILEYDIEPFLSAEFEIHQKCLGKASSYIFLLLNESCHAQATTGKNTSELLPTPFWNLFLQQPVATDQEAIQL